MNTFFDKSFKIFISTGAIYQSNHPFHLHGYSFRVVALEKLGNSTTSQTISMLNETNKIVRNLKNPPMKDTITVPDGGYTVIRFYTKNPGELDEEKYLYFSYFT